MAGDPVSADTWKCAQTGVGKGLGELGGDRVGAGVEKQKESEKESLLAADHHFKSSANQKQVLQYLA